MIKYTANSLLATMISFSNEIANLCSATGNVDVKEVFEGVHLDKRLTPIMEDGERIIPSFTTYLEAGCGFGGSCFPKDVKALIAYGRDSGSPMNILQAVVDINAKQPCRMISLLNENLGQLSGKRIALLGLAFKPGSDDVRESPAIPVLQQLLDAGCTVKAHDPIVESLAGFEASDQLTYTKSLPSALEQADAVLLMTR